MKTSVVALQNRGLARVQRLRGVWTATLTDDGRFFIANGSYPPDPHPPRPERSKHADDAPASGDKARGRTRQAAPLPEEFEIDSPAGMRARALKPRGDALHHPDAPDPWDARIMITVKEAAWLLSLSESEIRRAVTEGEIDRVFIGKGTTNYRVVYGSLLAWVNDMPREHSWRRWWSQ